MLTKGEDPSAEEGIDTQDEQPPDEQEAGYAIPFIEEQVAGSCTQISKLIRGFSVGAEHTTYRIFLYQTEIFAPGEQVADERYQQKKA